MSSFLG